MHFFCRQQTNKTNLWLPNGRTSICCSFGYLWLKDERGYSDNFKIYFLQELHGIYVCQKKKE